MSHQPKKQKVAGSARTGAAVAIALAVAFMAMANPAAAQELREREAIANNSGPGVSVRSAWYFPERGNTGLGVDASATYGVPALPLVIAPGVRFAGHFGDNGAISGMPIVEFMVPFGAIVPYLKGGIGVGHAMGMRETSGAFMGGGGLDVHVARDVLVGVDATYETVIGTGFNIVAIGPRAGLRY